MGSQAHEAVAEAPSWANEAFLVEGAVLLYVSLFAIAVVLNLFSRPGAELPERLVENTRRVYETLSFPGRWLSDVFLRWNVDENVVFVFLRMFVSTLICVLYVYVTYLKHVPHGIRVFQGVVGVWLLFSLIGRLIATASPISFVLSLDTTIESCSLASLILASGNMWLNWSFLQAYIVLGRYFQVEPVFEKMLVRKTSPVRRQLVRLVLEFVVFVYAFACGLQLFEVVGDPTVSLTRTTFELTLANSLYFTVVTIFTVGYGDFVMYTLLGRIWIVSLIVFGAYFLSRKVSEVIEVVVGLRRGLGSFVKDDSVKHCVLCGNIKWEYLKSFVQEFAADDHAHATKIVVMCEQGNWTEEMWNSFFKADPKLKEHVVYLDGSCITKEDMIRAQVETAVAVFVLNNQHNPEPYMEDSETLKRILSIRGFAPRVPIYSMCALRGSMVQITDALERSEEMENLEVSSRDVTSFGASAFSGLDRSAGGERRSYGATDDLGMDWGAAHLSSEGGIGLSGDGLDSAFGNPPNRGSPALSGYSDDDQGSMVVDYLRPDPSSDAICMQEVEMSMLAENVFCNGLSTLLSNLVLNVVPQSKPDDRPWMVEYKIGAECRLAYVPLPRKVSGKRFADIAVTLYDHGILLLALKGFSERKWYTITPATMLPHNTIGLVVTFHSSDLITAVMNHAANMIAAEDDELTGLSEGESTSAPDISSHDVPSSADDYDPGFPTATLSPGLRESAPPPNSVLHPLDVPGAVAEGARGSDLESASEHGLARSLPSSVALEGAQDSRFPFMSSPPPPPRLEDRSWHASGSRSRDNVESAHLSPTPAARPVTSGDGVDELDALADKYIAEQDIKGSDGAQSGQQRPSSPPPAPPENEAKRGGTTGLAAALDGASHAAPAENPQRRLGRQGSRVSFPASAGGSSRRRTSFTEPRGNRSRSQGKSSFSRARRRSSMDIPKIIYGDAPLPAHLRGHIVVCVIGQMGLINLRAFLNRVWMRRRDFKRETPVVAICPKITDEIEEDVEFFRKNQLFVIHGNSLCINTLTRAQFDRARAIVVLACEDKSDVDHMDAKALFTLMTLDYQLGEKSNTFVCTMIDAEESMQLLRAPTDARRRGVNLGRLSAEYSLYGTAMQASIAHHSPYKADRQESSASLLADGGSPIGDLRAAGGLERRIGQGGIDPVLGGRANFGGQDAWRRLSFADGLRLSTVSQTRSGQFVGSVTNQWSNRSAALRRLVSDTIANPSEVDSGRRHSSSHLRASATSGMLSRRQGDTEGNRLGPSVSLGGSSAMNFFLNSAPAQAGQSRHETGGLGRTTDATLGNGQGESGPSVANKRSELFERQRYASGEMMISSVFVALLIREFANPGMMSVVRKIFGVGVGKNHKSKKCWVRTAKICGKWIRAGENCQRIYRELFEVLLELECVPLGLYRCGEASVRVQLNPSADVELAEPEPAPDLPFAETSPLFAASPDGARQQSPILDVPSPEPLFYRCPTTVRRAYYQQVESGDNVLPYVYTNPEPFTLLSENDAVYILAHPSLKIPDDWMEYLGLGEPQEQE